MADFNFLHVFGAAMVVTTLKTTLFNPMSLIKTVMSSINVVNTPNRGFDSKAFQNQLLGFQKGLLKDRPELAQAMGKTSLLGPKAAPARR